jgi:hypothetical protein
MRESPGAREQRERRQRKEATARVDDVLDRLRAFAADVGRTAHDQGDEELLMTMEELAEWVEKRRIQL